MFAAAEGITRTDVASLRKYEQVRLTVRVDRPGTLLEDYHTVGGGFPKERTAATSGGSNKGAAVITRRQYLSDAVFVVAVTAPDTLAQQISAALRRPCWAPYLGRRSCAPDEPFLLRQHVEDPEAELLTAVPLTAPEPRESEVQTIAVQFLRERPLPQGGPGAAADVVEINDMPVSFAPHGRAHAGRRLYRTIEPVSRALTGPQKTLLTRLIDYAHAEEQA